MGAAKGAAKVVEGHVIEHQVQDHGRPAADLSILTEVDQAEQCHDILVVVKVGQPLAEPGSKAEIQPAQDTRAMDTHHLPARAPAVGETRLRIALARQVGPAGKEDLVILGPGAHRVQARLVGPVLEAQHGLAGAPQQGFGQPVVSVELEQQAQDAVQDEIGAVLAPFDIVQRGVEYAKMGLAAGEQAGQLVVRRLQVRWCWIAQDVVQECLATGSVGVVEGTGSIGVGHWLGRIAGWRRCRHREVIVDPSGLRRAHRS